MVYCDGRLEMTRLKRLGQVLQHKKVFGGLKNMLAVSTRLGLGGKTVQVVDNSTCH